MSEFLKLINKCLNCKNAPCVLKCPFGNNIPSVIKSIKEDDYNQARSIIQETSVFPEVCSHLCESDSNCSSACIRNKLNDPVRFNIIEQKLFNGYNEDFEIQKLPLKIKVAIIGSGIAGLTIAYKLLLAGIDVTIYEKSTALGGTIKEAIPEFRFDHSIFDRVIEKVKKLGLSYHLNYHVDEKALRKLEKEYHYVVITSGTMVNNTLNDFDNDCVLQGVDVLKSKDFSKFDNKNIIVVGAGNVAMDVARTLVNRSKSVRILYRRTITASPASKEEINDTLSKGVTFEELLSPTKLVSTNPLYISFEKMKLVYVEGSSRPNVTGTNEFENHSCDYLILALGSKTDYYTLGIDRNDIINKNNFGKVNYHENLLIAGDAHLGATTAAKASKSGIDCANYILQKVNDDCIIKGKIDELEVNKIFSFGGSFNPVTKAHQFIVNYVTGILGYDVILVPNGDKYNRKDLPTFDERVSDLEKVFLDNKKVQISTILKNQVFKGTYLSQRELDHPICIIGGDLIFEIDTWIEYETLVKENYFLTFNRGNNRLEEYLQNHPILSKYINHFISVNHFDHDISSSEYRDSKNIKLIPEELLKGEKNEIC